MKEELTITGRNRTRLDQIVAAGHERMEKRLGLRPGSLSGNVPDDSRNRLDRMAFDRHLSELRAKLEGQAAQINQRHAADFSALELRALQHAFDSADPYAARCRLNSRDEPFTWFHVAGLLIGVLLIALGVVL